MKRLIALCILVTFAGISTAGLAAYMWWTMGVVMVVPIAAAALVIWAALNVDEDAP